MQAPKPSDPDNETPDPGPTRRVILEPDFSGAAQPIGDWTERDGYPQCALGVHVSIHGFAGVVVEIVNQSIRVRSPEGLTQRFNAHRLKTLFAPRIPAHHAQLAPAPERSRPAAPAETAGATPAPRRVYIENPDFTAPVRAIRTYASQASFPQCAYGQHVDIPGYEGVVVEIVKGSLKVQCREGTIRSYNAGTLKKLYGQP